jgi:dihydroorotate dehydrogenase (NAD+) catalytic subunit
MGGNAMVNLTSRLGPIELKNPITTASGCFGSGRDLDKIWDVTEIGMVVAKSVTLEVREGLPTPRMAETPSGMLNAIGLQNPGVDSWLETELPWLIERGAPVLVSVAGKSVEDFAECARRIAASAPVGAGHGPAKPGVVGLEVNLSCPNVENRGLVFACKPAPSAEVIEAVREAVGPDLPIFGKLTADTTSVPEVAEAVMAAGATGLTLINTLLGMEIDWWSGQPALANTFGGFSGPAIRPVALRVVHQVAMALPGVPIIASGGIRTAEDVIRFLRAGASMVSFGTANFENPTAAVDALARLEKLCEQLGVAEVAELIATVTPRPKPEAFL